MHKEKAINELEFLLSFLEFGVPEKGNAAAQTMAEKNISDKIRTIHKYKFDPKTLGLLVKEAREIAAKVGVPIENLRRLNILKC